MLGLSLIPFCWHKILKLTDGISVKKRVLFNSKRSYLKRKAIILKLAFALIKLYISDFNCETNDDCNNGKGMCTSRKCDCKPGWKLHDCFGNFFPFLYLHIAWFFWENKFLGSHFTTSVFFWKTPNQKFTSFILLSKEHFIIEDVLWCKGKAG